MHKKLYKSDNKILAGVLAGFGDYTDTDPTVWRVGFAFVTVLSGVFPGIILYIIMMILIPARPEAPVATPAKDVTPEA